MNVNDFLQIDLTPSQIVLSYLLAFGLAFLWATVYRKTHSGVAYTRSFFLALILVSPTVAMIMMAIGSNIALSLGLVGALSIIRFRSVIKDTRDMAFLFMAIGIGLTAGAHAWTVGILGTITVSVIAVVLSQYGRFGIGSSDYILIFRSEEREPWNSFSEQARKLVSWSELRGATDVDQGREFEYTYNVRLAGETRPERLVGEISNGKIRDVTLIAPENHLEI